MVSVGKIELRFGFIVFFGLIMLQCRPSTGPQGLVSPQVDSLLAQHFDPSLFNALQVNRDSSYFIVGDHKTSFTDLNYPYTLSGARMHLAINIKSQNSPKGYFFYTMNFDANGALESERSRLQEIVPYVENDSVTFFSWQKLRAEFSQLCPTCTLDHTNQKNFELVLMDRGNGKLLLNIEMKGYLYTTQSVDKPGFVMKSGQYVSRNALTGKLTGKGNVLY